MNMRNIRDMCTDYYSTEEKDVVGTGNLNTVRRSLEMKVAILTSGPRKFYISASRQSPVGMPLEVAQVQMT